MRDIDGIPDLPLISGGVFKFLLGEKWETEPCLGEEIIAYLDGT